MTIHERIEHERRDQFYDWIRTVLTEDIPTMLQISGLIAGAWVLCGMCAA
jgi:hypothetical protein